MVLAGRSLFISDKLYVQRQYRSMNLRTHFFGVCEKTMKGLGPASHLTCYFRWLMAMKRLQTGKHGLLSGWPKVKANIHDWDTRLSFR